jgi:hypothetical protein
MTTAAVTVGLWFGNKTVERRQKRAEFRRAYIERQIEEFYGPLFSLIWQIFTTNDIKDQILENCPLTEEEQGRAEQYFTKTYFLPLHARAKDILETKLYLVDGTEMPQSVYEYLRHVLQQDSQFRLWADAGLKTDAVEGEPFPPSLFPTIQRTLKKLMVEYEVNLEELRTGTAREGRRRETPSRAEGGDQAPPSKRPARSSKSA